MESARDRRYRLEARMRPDVDPAAFRALDVPADQLVFACLVSREVGEATAARAGSAFDALAGIVPILEVLSVGSDRCPEVPDADPRGEALVVLELVEGPTLEELMRGGAGDPESAVRVMLGVADALAALHAAGGLHGGVTPLSIIVADDGAAHLGLAGVQDAMIAYQSPARLCDEGLSTADDAWALLACLYFAVTGGPPFHGENAGALARRVLGGRPAAIRTATSAEADLQTLFDRGFSRTPSKRYPSVGPLAADLRAWLALHAPSHVPEPVPVPVPEPEPEPEPEPVPISASAPAPPSVPPPPSPIPELASPPVPPTAEPPIIESSPRTTTHAPAAGSVSPLVVAPAERSSRWAPAVALVAVLGGAGLVIASKLKPPEPDPCLDGGPCRGPVAPAVATTAAPRPVAPAATTSTAPAHSAANPVDLDACVSAWFPPQSLDPDTDLAFVCDERDGRSAAGKLRRALLAGGQNKRITDAMKEWQRFGWFEAPVIASLRARCCPGAAPLEIPHVPGSRCTPPREAVQAIGAAAATGGDLTSAVRAYRKIVSCLVDVGDVPAYGQPGPIGVGEEPAFRAFAERGAPKK